mmetsp:Transcript_3715/g.8982  ORF Transcript_3715/g.8982 Transcript_3715/m.8982 type:complete len:251 (+) Transcript_3715:795-1547(+)
MNLVHTRPRDRQDLRKPPQGCLAAINAHHEDHLFILLGQRSPMLDAYHVGIDELDNVVRCRTELSFLALMKSKQNPIGFDLIVCNLDQSVDVRMTATSRRPCGVKSFNHASPTRSQQHGSLQRMLHFVFVLTTGLDELRLVCFENMSPLKMHRFLRILRGVVRMDGNKIILPALPVLNVKEANRAVKRLLRDDGCINEDTPLPSFQHLFFLFLLLRVKMSCLTKVFAGQLQRLEQLICFMSHLCPSSTCK